MKKFHALKQHLIECYPKLSIKVARSQISKKFDGYCTFKNGTFFIYVCKHLTEPQAIDVLLHEFAHCLSWEKGANEHGLHWGKAYSVVYRKFLKWHQTYE